MVVSNDESSQANSIRDSLTETAIRDKLGDDFSSLNINVYEITDSTNTQARLYAQRFPDQTAVFIADGQTQGAGRLGRSFYSERGAGLYISFLIHPTSLAKDAVQITAYAAVTVCKVLERLTGAKPKIKWVNDIYLSGKKLAGILTVGNIEAGSDKLSYAVCGIGINVYKTKLPEELEGIAVSLEDEGLKTDRASLAAELCREFLSGLDSVGSREISEEYRSRSFLVNKKVTVEKLSSSYPATVVGITDSCELELLLENGSREVLSTGEVSIRPEQNQ